MHAIVCLGDHLAENERAGCFVGFVCVLFTRCYGLVMIFLGYTTCLKRPLTQKNPKYVFETDNRLIARCRSKVLQNAPPLNTGYKYCRILLE